MKRKICVVTGTRAEYGLLQPLMKKIKEDCLLELQIVATGMHLSPEFGLTYKQIEQDGFVIHEKIEALLSSDTPVGIAKSMGLTTIGFADAFNRLQPDLLVILGDRFEMLAVAQTALALKIPIAHISGGEVTKGVIDDAIRHCITKMSHLHFVANEEYKKRVVQLGENPNLVFNVGDPGVENIRLMDFLTKEDLELFYETSIDKLLLVTFHPVTLDKNAAKRQLSALFESLDHFKDYVIVFTKGNADSEGRYINELIDEYAALNENVKVYTSLGSTKYLSTLKYAKAVIGNSSSGIVEAPVFGIPTINIGDRQEGRAKAISIIDCDYNSEAITEAIYKALDPTFIDSIKNMELKYDGVNTSEQICDIIKNTDITNIVKKDFYDLL